MNVLILGGTGFVGKTLAKHLTTENYQVAVSTRQNRLHGKTIDNIKYLLWNGSDAFDLEDIVGDTEIIINLIGENLSDGRWTEERKKNIILSRTNATEALAKTVPKLPKLKMLLQASAVGYYGYWDEENMAPIVTESSPLGSDFLATTCQKWESAIANMDLTDAKCCIMRFAPVLGNGGMLKALLPPFKMLAGGIPGHGRQPLSWIHIDDLAKAIIFLINQNTSGVYNFSAPNPCTMEKFIVTMAGIIKKPHSFPLPGSLLRLIYGDMAKSLILGGQRAHPEALHKLGFSFDFPNVESALQDIFEKNIDI